MNPSEDRGCSFVIESIDSYLDGELTRDDATRIEKHVARCARCRRELAVARGVLRELHRLPVLECPDEVPRRVLGETRRERVRERMISSGWLRRWFASAPIAGRRLAIAAAAAIVIVVALVISRERAPQEQFSPAEVEEAQEAVRWTFAYVNSVSLRSGLAVRDEVFGAGVVDPLRRAVRSAIDVEEPTKRENNGGSL